jgi:AraC-like DNA-binding protein
MQQHIFSSNILYSCVDAKERSSEQFVPEHALGYLISGESQLISPAGAQTFGPGSIGLIRRNQLVKSTKVPPPGGQFKSINIFLGQDTLRKYSTEHNISAGGPYTGDTRLLLSPDPFIKGFFDSLLPYFSEGVSFSASLIALKTNEAIELLLQRNYQLKDLLFDFSEPYKIDLEAFMQQHYMYNVPVSSFAKLTGRSLAGFKRDFEKIFNTSPGQWLLQKRLSEAYYLIKQKKKRPSDVYLEVGFENLSHFSYAFKKAYGVAPSLV